MGKIMAEQFEIQELLKVAVEDERSGVAYYSLLEGKSSDPKVKELFADLARQEKYHQQRFEKMLNDLGGLRTREQYPGEYMAYLRAMTSRRAFPDVDTARQKAQQAGGNRDAIMIALQFERDTLVLMSELRSMVPQKDRPIVDEVNREEQAHIVALTEALDRLV